MKYLIYLLVLFCGLEASAQQWNPKTAYWIYGADFMASYGDLRVSFLKDTLVDGHDCQVLKKDMIEYSYYDKTYSYRLIGKEVTYYASGVTYILNDNHFDTLYYFDGKIGDRYKVTDRLKWHPTDSGYAMIADTGSVIINTQKLKWQAIDYYLKTGNRQSTLRDTILEKMGATKYYFLPWDVINGGLDANEGGQLKCFNDSYFGNYTLRNSTGCSFDLSLVVSKKYEPYINENKVWKKVQTVWLTDQSQGAHYLVNQAYFKGDTLVDNYIYHKLYNKAEQTKQEKEYLAYLIREDTASQKVYVNDFRYNKTALLYDFNLKNGEEFNSYVIGGLLHKHTVSMVDTISLYNRKLKRIVFDDPIQWIEGIGNVTGGYIPSEGELICVTDHSMLMYLNPNYHNCDTIFTQGGWDGIKTIKNNAFVLYPNPVEANSVLSVKTRNNERLSIEIYSSTGALIKEDDFVNEYPIGSLNLVKGLYLYRIFSNRKLIKADKMVVQ
jgi:hypothetical protein